MAKHLEFGKLGEELAAQFLIKKGYEIVERNWRSDHKEIDIIAKDGPDFVIVEVKTRKTDDYGEPDMAVTTRKQHLLISAANAYLYTHAIDANTRFDIISIVFNNSEPVISHIEDAFLP